MQRYTLCASAFLFFIKSTCDGLLSESLPEHEHYADLQAGIKSINDTMQDLISRFNRLDRDSMDNVHDQILALNSTVIAIKASTNKLEQKMMTTPVAFLAELGKDVVDPPAGSPMIFDNVHLNDGSAYDEVNGQFTAPVSGLYHFTLELTRIPTTGSIYIRLMRSSEIVGYVYLEGNPKYHKKRSATTTLHLTKGDNVWVKVTNTYSPVRVLSCCFHSIFSGFLIKSD